MLQKILSKKVLTDPKQMLVYIIGREGSEREVGKICEQHLYVVPWLLARIDGVNMLRDREGKPPTFEKYVCAARSALAAGLIERDETSAAEAQLALLRNLPLCSKSVIEHLDSKIHHIRTRIARERLNASIANIMNATESTTA